MMKQANKKTEIYVQDPQKSPNCSPRSISRSVPLPKLFISYIIPEKAIGNDGPNGILGASASFKSGFGDHRR